MKKYILLIISLLLVLSLCGCGANATPESQMTPTPTVAVVATPVPTPAFTIEPTPSPTKQVEYTGWFIDLGEYDLSPEQYENLAKITKESILNFFENGFDTSDPNYLKIIRNTQDGGQVEYEGLGIMETSVGGDFGEIVYCQACILGAEIMDGYPIIFFGCENKDKELVVFPCRYDTPSPLLASDNNTDYDTYRVNEQWLDLVYDSPESFYNFICDNTGRIALIQVRIGPVRISLEDFCERNGQTVDDSNKEFYYLESSGTAAGAEIFRNINIVDESLSDWDPENEEIFEEDVLLSGDNIGDDMDLFRNIPADRFPRVEFISMYDYNWSAPLEPGQN